MICVNTESVSDRSQIFAALTDGFFTGHAGRRAVKLDDQPVCTSFFRRLCDGINRNASLTERAEFKSGTVAFGTRRLSDQVIGRIGFFTRREVVFQMDDRAAAGVFLQVFDRVFTGKMHPAGVEFRLQQICGNRSVKLIQRVLTVDFSNSKS